jgi:hypothetical protein
VRATEDWAEISGAPTLATVNPARSSRPGGKQEMVAAENAEDTNCRRETPGFLLMMRLLL